MKTQYKTTLSLFAIVAIVAMAIMVATACTPPAAPTPVVINNTNTNTISGPGTIGGGTPTPVPGSQAIVFIRTGFFGGNCPDGSKVENSKPLNVGCIGFATATPLGPGDVKLGPESHGYECRWETSDASVADLNAVENPFNIDVVAKRPGKARITATVMGKSGSFDVVVQ